MMLPDIVNPGKRSVLLPAYRWRKLVAAGRLPCVRPRSDGRAPASRAISGTSDGTAQAYVSHSYFQPGGANGCGDIKHLSVFSNTKSSNHQPAWSVVNAESIRRRRPADR